jgi:hypothetical protein
LETLAEAASLPVSLQSELRALRSAAAGATSWLESFHSLLSSLNLLQDARDEEANEEEVDDGEVVVKEKRNYQDTSHELLVESSIDLELLTNAVQAADGIILEVPALR